MAITSHTIPSNPNHSETVSLTYTDYFGLASEVNNTSVDESYFYGEYKPHCFCERHRDCKCGGNIVSALGGVTHGAVDFAANTLHDLQTAMVYIGCADMEQSYQERLQIINAVEQSQANQMAQIESLMMDLFSVDEFDDVYHSFRSTTNMGLEIGSLVIGGYGAVKGIIAFNRLARAPAQISKIIKSEEAIANHFLTQAKIKNYLSKAESLNKRQIVSDIKSTGLRLKGKSPNGRFLEFQDKYGRVRIKIHPPDKRTPYDHLHIYDKKNNSLNKSLKIVDKYSVDAHIPYGGE